MKYVITFKIPLRRDSFDEYPCVEAYLKAFQWNDRRLIPSIDWTPYVHEALQYADCGAARCIKDIVNRRFVGAEVVGVTDKELFKAKLAER